MKTKTALALTAVLALSLAFGAPGASASRSDPPGHRDSNHCVTAAGVDLNDVLGVSDQVVGGACPEVSAGEHWIPPAGWFTEDSDPVYPEGYEWSREPPSEDFVARLVAVKVVVDGGTRRERTHTFAPSEVVRTDLTPEQFIPDLGAQQPGWAVVELVPRMAPVSVGDHTAEVIAVLSADHCDGIHTLLGGECIPAGDDSFGVRRFTVTQPTS